MAKNIKFNLICDGYPVRTLEELQKHFSINDILDYYKSKDQLLLRWLELRDYNEEYNKVKAISETDDKEIFKQLAEIFGIIMDEEDIDCFFHSEAFRQEKYSRNNAGANAELKAYALIEKYRRGYLQQLEELKSKVAKNRRNALVKLNTDYKWVFDLCLAKIIEDLKSTDNLGALIDFLFLPDLRKLISETNGDLKFDLKGWFAYGYTKKIVEKNGFELKRGYGMGIGKVKELEPEGTFCYVLDINEYGLVSSVNKRNWVGQNKNKNSRPIYNGLLLKDVYDWEKSDIKYIIIDP